MYQLTFWRGIAANLFLQPPIREVEDNLVTGRSLHPPPICPSNRAGLRRRFAPGTNLLHP